MIVDSHCHAWTVWPYDTAVPDPEARGRVEQLLFEMDRNAVDRAVVVCARIDHNPDNNEYIAAEVARRPDRLEQFADVDCSWSPEYHTDGAADRLARAADRWPIAGFTHYVQSENDGWLLTEEGAAFFQAAADRNLIASIAAGPAWFADLATVAAAHPSMPILLHHQAQVRGVDGVDSADLRALERLAAHPNIGIKASGFYYGSAAFAEYPYADQIAVFERIHRAFGAHRVAWGSDFPVSPWAACTYVQALDVVRRHCPFLTEADLRAIMGETMATLLSTRRPVASPT